MGTSCIAEGRLCAVDGYRYSTGMTGYVYDALDHRVAKGTISSFNCDVTQNGFSATNEYIYGLDGEPLDETDGSGNNLHSNVYADGRLLATYKNSSWYYALNDWLGTKRVETDGNGAVVATFDSLPFGDGLTTNGGPDATEQHFTGKERDTESGNDYFGARYYASSMGAGSVQIRGQLAGIIWRIPRSGTNTTTR